MGEPIKIVPYNPDWADTFSRLRDLVAPALGHIALTMEHVGSTSVSGLVAKPIIDIDVVVASIENVPTAVERLESLGYRHEGDLGIPGREAFRAPGGLPDHHLYVCSADTPELRKHSMFRDYRRSHPDEAKAYGELKMALADLFTHDREAYTESKSAFVNSRLKQAGWNE
jgi:GrpB-like predicted nucleotidyltransferase (UPF0157 family)